MQLRNGTDISLCVRILFCEMICTEVEFNCVILRCGGYFNLLSLLVWNDGCVVSSHPFVCKPCCFEPMDKLYRKFLQILYC
jgi:hypothetical protein